MPVSELRGRLAALRPKPWPSDRPGAAAALRGWRQGGGVVYAADGLTDAPAEAWDGFAAALTAAGPVLVLQPETTPGLLLPPRAEADRLVARVALAPLPLARSLVVLAQAGDGRSLARVSAELPAGAAGVELPIALPPELRNRLARLVLEGPATAGGVVLLDERWRRRPVGLVAGDATSADTPLTGPLFYLRRALDPFTEVREGDLKTLLARELSVLILADHVVPDGPERDLLAQWVQRGGLLLRFAGPQTADSPDDLLPVKLLAGDRQLGGAMSWSQPSPLAAFAPGVPFGGLAVPEEVRVSRQVLAEPGAHLAEATWARLADGTPLVTQATRGAGRVVLFHVTANADWSDLPLSGLFVDMLRRLVALASGVAGGQDEQAMLAPVETLDGFGQLAPPPPAAAALSGADFARIAASPLHPPGLYGPENGRRTLNLSARLAPPVAAPEIAGARREPVGGAAPARLLAPWLLAAALALLALDLLVSLRLRGLWRPRTKAVAAAALLALLGLPAQAQAPLANPAQATNPALATNLALATRLAYVVTGDDQLDAISRAGLVGLSDYVNRRTAAALAEPAAIVPGQDDLSFYPLLYWPIAADAPPLSGAAIASLNDFMAHGGIVLIDTRDGGSGEGFSAGAGQALQRLGQTGPGGLGLAVPPLAPLTGGHVLARAFYLLQDFPGRFAGDTVWVQRDQDRANDSVSPVIIGGHDWASAWAIDAAGRNPYAVLPGGARQRTLAYRFGVNLVMYALTGNYKGDQVHVPALLERLGQ